MSDPAPRNATRAQPDVLRVSALVQALKAVVDRAMPDVWVEGEVTEASRSASGHLYFLLADAGPVGSVGRQAVVQRDDVAIKCVVFKTDLDGLAVEPRQGIRVRVRARSSVFPARAQLQMVVSAVLLAGEGEREAARRKLREKLQAEGLFALERKRALPRVPRVVGLATSKNGAAFGDVVRVARGRFPVTLLLANCKVQGPDAPGSIARAIEALAQRPEMDVIIVARGGGASEDLSAFDEEEVVRAIAGCRVPIVTGVGHEVDVTLADLAADVRGATPSNAAERAVPDGQALRHELTSATRRLQQAFDAKVRGARLRLAQLASRVTGRRALLRARKDELARLERTIERAMRRRIEHARRQRGGLDARLAASDPRRALARTRTSLDRLTPRLGVQMRARLAAARRALADVRASLDQGMRDALVHERSAHGGLDARLLRVLAPSLASRRAALALLAGRLDALSPLAVLGRGYAIALDARTGKALTRAADVAPGDRLHVRLERGAIEARVESVTPAEDES